MEYKSETNRPKSEDYAQKNFSKYIDKYEDLLNPKTGKMETKVTDREDFYEKIQSHKESQLLESIIKRYEIDIDKEQVKEIENDIVDMTAIPETMTEAYAMIKQVENEFDQRPAEIKKAFNNNVGEYVAGIQNGKLKEVLNKYQGIKEEPKKSEELNKQTQTISQEAITKMVQEQIEKSIQGGNVNV